MVHFEFLIIFSKVTTHRPSTRMERFRYHETFETFEIAIKTENFYVKKKENVIGQLLVELITLYHFPT